MKLSPSWIRDFVELKVDDHRLAEDLTSIGIAAEGISGSGEKAERSEKKESTVEKKAAEA